MCLRVDMYVLHILCLSRVFGVCMSVSECVCSCSLKAEPSSILRNRELTEHRQTSAVGVVDAPAAFRAAERARRAASILVLV